MPQTYGPGQLDPRDSNMGPLSKIPGMTYVSPIQPAPRRSAAPLVIGLATLLALVGVGIAMYANFASSPTAQTVDPTTIFTDAIMNGFTTKSLERVVTGIGHNYTMLQDVSDVTTPKMSVAVLSTDPKQVAEAQIYGTVKNTYINYAKASPALLSATELNYWIAVRQNWVLPTNITTAVEQFTDPAYLTMGAFLFGNFSSDQRAMLQTWLGSHQVYQFDPAKVQSGTMNGREVLSYIVTYDNGNLAALNMKVGEMYHMGDAEMAPVLKTLPYYGANLVTVDVASRHIVKVQYTYRTTNVTQVFEKFDSVTLPAEPRAARSYNQLFPLPDL